MMKTSLDYYKLLDSLGDGIICINEGNEIEYVNEKAFELLSTRILPEAKVPIKLFFNVKTQNYGTITEDIAQKARRTGVSQGLLKDAYIEINHKKHFLSATFSPFEMDDQTYVVISFRDISEHKEIESEVNEHRINAESIINALPLGIIVVDEQRHVVRINDFISHNFGTFHPTMEEQYLGNILKCANSRNTVCGFSDACKTCKVRAMISSLGEDEHYTSVIHHISHHFEYGIVERDYEIGCVKLYMNNETELMLIIHDITNQMKYEQLIRKEKESAEQASRLKTEFLSKVSHEIRTPVHGIIGMVDLTSMIVQDPEVLENLSTIKLSGQNLTQIVDKVLDISKMETGVFDLEEYSFSMSDLLKKVRLEQDSLMDNPNVTLIIDEWEHSQDIFEGDFRRIKQIFTYLIENSRKFTEQGSIQLSHRLLSPKSTYGVYQLEFHIVDTGIGISEVYQARMFETFTQDDGSYTRQVGGIGLGLAITKKIIDKLGGVITCNSQVNEGTDFYVRIPLAKGTEHVVDVNRKFDYRIRTV